MLLRPHLAASLFAASVLLGACATQASSNLSADEKDAAIKACIEKFDNWPTRKNACINSIRTSSAPEAVNKNEETEK